MNTQQSADVEAAVERQLSLLTSGLDPAERAEATGALRAWFERRLPEAATLADVEALAAEVEDAAEPTQDPTQDPTRPVRMLRGRVLGVPYDFTRPTASKVAARLWDPMDPHLWQAHVFGIGWAPNLGAAAVRLGLIEPDGEDVPFERTSQAAFRVAAALPVAVSVATALHYAVVPLPELLPRHWNWAGVPDRWVPKERAARTDLATSLAAVTGAVWAATSHERGPGRAGAAAASSGLATIVAGTVMLSAQPGPRRLAGPGLAMAVLLSTGGTLWGLARSGRAAEIRHDLADPGQNPTRHPEV